MNTFKNLASANGAVENVANGLEKVAENLDTDKQFLIQGMLKAQKAYTDKREIPNPPKKVLVELSSERVEYSELLQQCQSYVICKNPESFCWSKFSNIACTEEYVRK